MAYTVEPVEVVNTRLIDPRSKKDKDIATPFKWWLAQNDRELVAQTLSTTDYLKKTNAIRVRQCSIFARLTSGKPLYNFLASSSTLDNSNQLPIGRPTANICFSATDTLCARISQDRPAPTFLTDAGHFKEQILAERCNQFLAGELYRTKAYDLAALQLRDGTYFGDGFIKVFAQDNKVKLERTLTTELLTDWDDAYYNDPRQLIHVKLVDRGTFLDLFPDHADIVAAAQTGHVDSTPRSTESITDRFIISEAWHLPSGEDATDGRHVIVCSAGVLLDKPYTRKRFPVVKFSFNPSPVGWYSQGLVEILMPTQMEIYRQLIVGSQNFELMGVPRVLIEEMSKILETSFNNRVGSIIKYRNTPPEFVNASSNEPGWLPYVQWLIQNAYQISGISALSATGSKPAGLNSGESIREFDRVQDSRQNIIAQRYQNIFTDLSYLMIDVASDIAKETGKYLTVYPGKDGTREVDFKHIRTLKDTYVIQCFEASSLPKDPAGRQARLSEKLAAGEITVLEFRRLSANPDLKQSDSLALALYDRIQSNLDAIIEDGKKGYEAPDQYILDPTDLATQLTVNYINKYIITDIEPEKIELLQNYFTQIQDLKRDANPPPPVAPPPGGQLPIQPPEPSVAPTSGAQV